MRFSNIFLIITFALLSCGKQGPHDERFKEIEAQMNKVQATPGGNFFKCVPLNDEHFKIEWGNDSFKNESQTVYPFFTNTKMYLAWENKEFIVLRTDIIPETGWLYYFLPLTQGKPETELENPVAYDSETNIVVSEGFKSDTVLLINNIFTKKVQPVIETEKCWNKMFFHRCIDSIALTKTHLYYKFQVEREKSEKNRKIERLIEIEILTR